MLCDASAKGLGVVERFDEVGLGGQSRSWKYAVGWISPGKGHNWSLQLVKFWLNILQIKWWMLFKTDMAHAIN